ncbi:MAG: hypothetical protein ACYST6_01370 [Planctomycetota bacterium]|jgi:hypothetical protein
MSLLRDKLTLIVIAGVTLIGLVFQDAAEAAPKDPPVSSGGEGATGNDWTDYGTVSSATLYYRRSGTNDMAPRLRVQVEASSSNCDPDHCRTSDVSDHNVTHLHYNKDYADDFGGSYGTVTVAEGDDYWEWSYDGYDPVPSTSGSASGKKNCVCYAYHIYKGSNTKANYWVNQSAASKYRDELYEIDSSGDNGEFDTEAGDRCDDASNHVWVVEGSRDCEAAYCIVWKNNSSQTFTWSHDDGDETNDCPEGDRPTNTKYTTYAIYNRTDR